MQVYTLQFGAANASGEFAELVHSETVSGHDLVATIERVRPIVRGSGYPDADIVRLLDDDGVVMWSRPREVV